MRPLGSSVELERRRIEAIKLLEGGLQPVAVARLVGVGIGEAFGDGMPRTVRRAGRG